jgi:hypothetical protein
MDYNTLQHMFLNGTVYEADLPKLTACLQFINGQPNYIDSRFEKWVTTLHFLISERQKQVRQKEETERTKNEIANARPFPRTTSMVEKTKALDVLGELKAKIPSLRKMSPSGTSDYSTWYYNIKAAIHGLSS